MGNCFPHESGLVNEQQVIEDKSLQRIENHEIPEKLELWVEKEVIEDLPNPLIIDVAISEKIDMVFIPPIPRPLEEYDFYCPTPQ